MEQMNSFNLDHDVARIDSVFQMEMLNVKDIGDYVHEFLLPNLQNSYKHAKKYLPNTSRRNIYCIKKHLADLVDDQQFVKISNGEDLGSEFFTKYEALFLAMESLNLIYSFCIIMRSKLTKSGLYYSKAIAPINNIIKLIPPIQREVRNSMELDQSTRHYNI